MQGSSKRANQGRSRGTGRPRPARVAERGQPRHPGKNPTSTAFIKNLRSVSSSNDGGILPSPVTFEHFVTVGMLPKTKCEYFVQPKGTAWHLYKTPPSVATEEFRPQGPDGGDGPGPRWSEYHLGGVGAGTDL